MFDTHCHLQDERMEDAQQVISRAVRAGVRNMLCCGTRQQDWEAVARISSRYECVRAAFGIHPWFVSGRSSGWLQALKEQLCSSSSTAVGEIGLDHTVDPRNDKEQAQVFTQQLELAQKLGKPVSIHCRKAWGDLQEILQARGGLEYGGVIHSYSGSPELVSVLEKLNCHISFSGSIVNTRNKRAANSLLQISSDRLLIETDSPDLLPRGLEGPLNEPANLVKIAERIAELLGKSVEDIARGTEQNAGALFKIPV
ncbi:MAG: TatD family hydrolase [Chitinispirillaceae bacterium]